MGEGKRDIVVWLSLVISLGAATFTGLQWWDARQQNHVAIRPVLSFMYQPDDTEPRVGLRMDNVGLGPAVLKSIVYFVDRIPTKDPDEVLRTGKLNLDPVEDWDFDPDETLKIGEEVWLFGRSTKNKKGLDTFIDFISDHVGVSVTYCSLADECRTICSTAGRC